MATKNKKGWFEDFFSGLYAQVLATTFTPEQTARHVQTVRRLLRLRKGQCVLDIPCGHGRLTIPLARAGLRMTGVDLTSAYIRRARRLARDEGLDVRFLQADMRTIGFDGEFDAAFNWFGSFGYFSDVDNLDLLRRLRRSLRPGGKLLLEGLNKTFVLSDFRTSLDESIGGIDIRHTPRFDPRTSRVLDTWTFRKGDRVERHRIALRLYSGPEIRRLLREAGFVDIEVYGLSPLRAATGSPNRRHRARCGRLTRASRRWIAVARRPVHEDSPAPGVPYTMKLADGRIVYVELPKRMTGRDRGGALTFTPEGVRFLDRIRAQSMRPA